jgi:hypothetical protein
MYTGGIAVLLCFLHIATAVVSPLQKDVNQTILPCQTKYYSFSVSPTFSQFYFEVYMTSTNALSMTVIDQNPESSNGTSLCLAGYTSSCITLGFGLPNCTVQLRCALPTGTWYAVIQNSAPSGASTFSLTYSVFGYKAPVILRINDNKNDPVRAEGIIQGPDLGCSDCDPKNTLDYFQLTIPLVDTVGSRLVINVKHSDNDTSTLNTYLTYKQDVGCRGAAGGLQTEIGPCQMNQTQGATWFLTVERTISFQNYSVKVYVDRMRFRIVSPCSPFLFFFVFLILFRPKNYPYCLWQL